MSDLDLKERLRSVERGEGHSHPVKGPDGEPATRVIPYGNMMHQAADRIAALEDALRPFAEAAAEYDGENGIADTVNFPLSLPIEEGKGMLSIGDLRNARAVLKGDA